MVAMQNSDAVAVEKPSCVECIEYVAQDFRGPAIDQIAGNGQMVGIARSDAIQLALQPGRIARVPDVQVREMRDQHTSGLCTRKVKRTAPMSRSEKAGH